MARTYTHVQVRDTAGASISGSHPQVVAGLVVGASLFVACAAHLSVPLPWTPVPLTLGNLAVLLVGLSLGPRAAFSALALYLAEGAAGLPVFSATGPGGIAQLVGPTGGFLFSYPLAAATVSLLSRRLATQMPRWPAAALGCAAATVVVMIAGTAWLGVELHLSVTRALQLGLLPFLPGELIKIVSAAGVFASVATLRSTAREPR